MQGRCARRAERHDAVLRPIRFFKRLFVLTLLLLSAALLSSLTGIVSVNARRVLPSRTRRRQRGFAAENEITAVPPAAPQERERTDSTSSEESASAETDILEDWVPFEASRNIDLDKNWPMLYPFRSTQNLHGFLVPLLISAIQPHYREAKFLKNQQQCYLKYSSKLLDAVYNFFLQRVSREIDIHYIAVHPDLEMVTFIHDLSDLYIELHCPGLGPVFHNQFLLSQSGIYNDPEWKARVYPDRTLTLYSPDGSDYPILPFRLMYKNVVKQFPKIFKYNREMKTVFKGIQQRQPNAIFYTQFHVGYDMIKTTDAHRASGNLLLSIPETYRNPAYTSYMQTVAYFASGIRTKPMPIYVNAQSASSPVSGPMPVFEYEPSMQQSQLTEWLFESKAKDHVMTLFFSTGSGASGIFGTGPRACHTKVTAVTFHEKGCARVATRGDCLEKRDLEFFTLRYDKKDPPPPILQWHNEIVLSDPLNLKITQGHTTLPSGQVIAELASETQQRFTSVLFTNRSWRNWKFILQKRENAVTILPGQKSALDRLNSPTLSSEKGSATKKTSAGAQFVLSYIDILKGLRTGAFHITRTDESGERMISVAFTFSRPFPCEMQTGLDLKSDIVTAKVLSKRGRPQYLLLDDTKIPIAYRVQTSKNRHLPADILRQLKRE